jgi:indolepyruvate ferredoxin oxidoreductase alpha subunit
VIIGEDYGEGSSIMQERSHAFAMKSQMWLLDPRPNLESIVAMVEHGFALSEASNTPVMLELRIRACHVYGSFIAKDNHPPKFTLQDALDSPVRDVNRIVLPPANFLHEQEKIQKRWPAAIDYVRRNKLNEFLGGSAGEVGIIVQGGLYNTLIRALELSGLADATGETELPLYVLNVTYPLIDEEIIEFCRGKRAVLMIEEGQPEYIEQAFNSILRNADVPARVIGKEVLPRAGEYTGQVLQTGVRAFMRKYAAEQFAAVTPLIALQATELPKEVQALAALLPVRPAGFCTGCPERPIFSAMKLVQRELGPLHISCDIGCHLFSILPPFNLGNTTMGYGLGAAGASAFNAPRNKRALAVMGDGGFWHNGLTSGVGNAVFNQSDQVLVAVAGGSGNSRASSALAGCAFDGSRTIWSVADSPAVSLASR